MLDFVAKIIKTWLAYGIYRAVFILLALVRVADLFFLMILLICSKKEYSEAW